MDFYEGMESPELALHGVFRCGKCVVSWCTNCTPLEALASRAMWLSGRDQTWCSRTSASLLWSMEKYCYLMIVRCDYTSAVGSVVLFSAMFGNEASLVLVSAHQKSVLWYNYIWEADGSSMSTWLKLLSQLEEADLRVGWEWGCGSVCLSVPSHLAWASDVFARILAGR